MLTFLSTPKPFTGPFGEKNLLAFRNAVGSWRRLESIPQILMFGGDPEIIKAEGCKWLTGFPTSPENRPLFNSFVRIGEELGEFDLMMYVTDHLILTQDFIPAVRRAFERFDQAVVTGRRWDVKIDKPIPFEHPDWRNIIRQHTLKEGGCGSTGTKDYIIWKKPFPVKIPPFILGFPWYDTWMVVAAQRAGIPVVNASKAIFAIHADHTFPFQGGIKGREITPGTAHNRKLAEGMEGLGLTTQMGWIMDHNKICRKGEPDCEPISEPIGE